MTLGTVCVQESILFCISFYILLSVVGTIIFVPEFLLLSNSSIVIDKSLLPNCQQLKIYMTDFATINTQWIFCV